MTAQQLALEIIRLAAKNMDNDVDMKSSALFCLSDAIMLFENKEFLTAAYRAFRSLEYSVGVFGTDHHIASALINLQQATVAGQDA